MRNTLGVVAVVVVFSLVGCGDDPKQQMMMSGGGGPPGMGGTDPRVDPGTPPLPATASYAGTYEVTAPLDFTQSGVLPGIVGPALGGLAELHDRPGAAILTIVEHANVPVLSSIVSNVPGFLRGVLSGLLDQLIIQNVYQGYPVVDQVAWIIQGITELSKTIEVHDAVTVRAGAGAGDVDVEQQVTAVSFVSFGQRARVELPLTARPAALAKGRGALTAHANAPVADADVALDAATFTLPVGELILQAASPLLFETFGGAKDLGGALKTLVPCDKLGVTLSHDLLTFLSASDAAKLCEGALGLVAAEVESRLRAVTLSDIHVEGAKGTLLDVSMAHPAVDHQSDRLTSGTWTWRFQVGDKHADVPSTFSGDRMP